MGSRIKLGAQMGTSGPPVHRITLPQATDLQARAVSALAESLERFERQADERYHALVDRQNTLEQRVATDLVELRQDLANLMFRFFGLVEALAHHHPAIRDELDQALAALAERARQHAAQEESAHEDSPGDAVSRDADGRGV
ncbi:MAG: hypothetical protein K6V97_03950 [Actinomycetia bacterium]|nr:hypothetical protein [Actinomycetes bacterium]